MFSDLNWKEAVLGLGAAHEDIRELAKAYQEAKQAIKYHSFLGKNMLLFMTERRFVTGGKRKFTLW